MPPFVGENDRRHVKHSRILLCTNEYEHGCRIEAMVRLTIHLFRTYYYCLRGKAKGELDPLHHLRRRWMYSLRQTDSQAGWRCDAKRDTPQCIAMIGYTKIPLSNLPTLWRWSNVR